LSKLPVEFDKYSPLAAECNISGKYLRFKYDSNNPNLGTPVWVDLMTDNTENVKPKGLAEFCLTLEDLRPILVELQAADRKNRLD
jgi:hypothetical protein